MRCTHPQHIVHKCSPSGTDFDKFDSCFWLALAYPFGHEPDTEELPKHLGDLR